MNEQTSTSSSPEALARQEDQANLDYFLEQVGAQPAMNQLRPDQMRTIVETALWLRMDAAKTSESSRDIEAELHIVLQNDGKSDFVPKTRAEAQTIIITPERRLAKAAQIKRTEPLESAKTTFLQMVNRHKDALTEMDIINRLMSESEIVGHEPNAEILRNDRDALNMLGDRLMQRDFLVNDHWPAKNTHEYKNLQSYCRGTVLAAAKWAGNDVLESLIAAERSNTKNRLVYWREKINSVAKTTAGVALKTLLDKESNPRHRPAEEELTHQLPDSEDSSAKKIAIRVKSYEEYIPDQAEQALVEQAKIYEGKSHRIETLARQSMSHRAAEISVLGSPGTYYKGQLVGVEPKEQQPSAEARVRSDLHTRTNPALKAGIRRLPGYDKRPDK